jgi:ABC-type multidrug transport system fused ATPase/permease subunit
MTTPSTHSEPVAGSRVLPPLGAPVRTKLQGALPPNVFRFVLETSGLHQLALVALSIAVFLIEIVPLELQRRIVNDLVKHRDFRLVIALCALYVGVVLAQGGIKLALNVYRGWVGERATRDLRRRLRALVGEDVTQSEEPEKRGVGVSMILAEVEPVGGFVGASISEPLLQAGVLLSVFAYMIHLELLVAVAGMVLILPQLVFVPMMQRAINRRTGSRVWVLRQLTSSLVAPAHHPDDRSLGDDRRIERVYRLNMGIIRLRFTMNLLMNYCTHLQVVSALLIGGWFVANDQLEIGGVVAFVSAVGRLTDPWGDLVNYFRDVSTTNLKYGLIAAASRQFRLASAGTDKPTAA